MIIIVKLAPERASSLLSPVKHVLSEFEAALVQFSIGQIALQGFFAHQHTGEVILTLVQ